MNPHIRDAKQLDNNDLLAEQNWMAQVFKIHEEGGHGISSKDSVWMRQLEAEIKARGLTPWRT